MPEYLGIVLAGIAGMPNDIARHFRRNSDGSWTCMSHATLHCPKGRIQVTQGSRFYPGTEFMGFDLARWLEEQFDRAEPRT